MHTSVSQLIWPGNSLANPMWQLFNGTDFGKCGFAPRTNESKDKESIPCLVLMWSDGFLWKGRLGRIFCKPRKPGSGVSCPLDHGNFSFFCKKKSYSGTTAHLGKVSATSEHFSFPRTGNSPIFYNKWALKTSFVNYPFESQILFWLHGETCCLKSPQVFFIIQMLHCKCALLS